MKVENVSLATVSQTAKIQQVIRWILEGNTREAIEEAIADTWPDEKHKPLIVAAMSALKRSARSMRTNATAWCIESLRFLYQKQVEIGEYAGAMRAVKQIADLAMPKSSSPPLPAPAPNVNVQVNIADADRNRVIEFAERVRAQRISDQSAG